MKAPRLQSGNYTFQLQCVDGCAMWVNGAQVIYSTARGSHIVDSSTISLSTQPARIVVACGHTDSTQCNLYWRATGFPLQVIAAAFFKLPRVNLVATMKAGSKSLGRHRVSTLDTGFRTQVEAAFQLNSQAWVANISMSPAQGSWTPSPNDQTSFFGKFQSRFS